MRTIKKVPINHVYVERIPEVLEEQTIYISQEYQTASHLCLCGCKNLTVTPLGLNGWTISENQNKLDITPSIGNFQFPCHSHYIITNSVANFV